ERLARLLRQRVERDPVGLRRARDAGLQAWRDHQHDEQQPLGQGEPPAPVHAPHANGETRQPIPGARAASGQAASGCAIASIARSSALSLSVRRARPDSNRPTISRRLSERPTSGNRVSTYSFALGLIHARRSVWRLPSSSVISTRSPRCNASTLASPRPDANRASPPPAAAVAPASAGRAPPESARASNRIVP